MALTVAQPRRRNVDYSATRASWHGASYDAVVAQWGQPGGYTVMEDGRYVYSWLSESGTLAALQLFIFVDRHIRRQPGVGVGVGTGFPIGGGGGGQVVRCQRTLLSKRHRRGADLEWQLSILQHVCAAKSALANFRGPPS